MERGGVRPTGRFSLGKLIKPLVSPGVYLIPMSLRILSDCLPCATLDKKTAVYHSCLTVKQRDPLSSGNFLFIVEKTPLSWVSVIKLFIVCPLRQESKMLEKKKEYNNNGVCI